MSTVVPSGIFAIASWNPRTGGDTESGRASGNNSGISTSRPMTRKIQRRSSVSSARRQSIRLVLPAQVGALDPEDDAQPGRHDPERGADQDRPLRGVLGPVHDPF